MLLIDFIRCRVAVDNPSAVRYSYLVQNLKIPIEEMSSAGKRSCLENHQELSNFNSTELCEFPVKRIGFICLAETARNLHNQEVSYFPVKRNVESGTSTRHQELSKLIFSMRSA
jgi:hypothetical protein